MTPVTTTSNSHSATNGDDAVQLKTLRATWQRPRWKTGRRPPCRTTRRVTPTCYLQPRQAHTPVFRLLRGRFWGFSSLMGDTLHRWEWNLDSSPTPNFIPSVHGWGVGPE